MKKSKLAKSSQRIPSPVEGFVLKTEWTATAKIMEWINSIIKDKNLPIGISEVETKLKGEGKRPDIIISGCLKSQFRFFDFPLELNFQIKTGMTSLN